MELKRSRLLFSFFLTLLMAAFIALPGMALADDETSTPDADTATTQSAEESTQNAKAQSNEKPVADSSAGSSATNQLEPAQADSQASGTQPSESAVQTPDAGNDQPQEGEAAVDGDTSTDPADSAEQDEVDGNQNAGDEEASTAETQDTVSEQAAGNADNTSAVSDAATTVTAAAVASKTTTAAKTTAKKASGQAIPNGWYYIASKKLISLVLSTAKGGKNAVVKTDKAQKKQQWYVAYNAAKKAYTLYNASSKKYLSIKSTKKGANVRLVKSGKSAKSLWVISAVKNGYTLKAYSCKYLLDINGGKKVKNGANVDIDKRKKSGSSVKSYQRWFFIPKEVKYDDPANYVDLGDGYYAITLTNSSSTAATVPNSTTTAGTQLTASGYASGLNQKYVLHKEADGTYTLQSIATAKYVGISGSKVVQGDATGDNTQKWRIINLTSGRALLNVATNKTLSLAGGKAVAGGRVNTPAVRLNLSKKNLLDNGNFYIHIASGTSANIMTVTKGSKSNNAAVSVQKKTFYNDNGTFTVKHLGGDVYQFTNLNSGKVLIASGSKAVQGAASGNNYKWTVAMDPVHGGVTLTNVATKKLLSSGTNAGNTVSTQAATGADTQTWHVEKAQVLKAYQKKALKKVLKRGSKKNYYLFADLGKARMMIWERANKKSEWHLKYDYIIAYGRIEGGKSRTPTGDYKVYGKLRWLDSAGDWNGYWSAPWAVRWSWAWFHARTHAYKHSSHVVDKRLGLPISNGCIRQPDFYAKWIYDNHKKLRNASVTVWKNGRF